MTSHTYIINNRVVVYGTLSTSLLGHLRPANLKNSRTTWLHLKANITATTTTTTTTTTTAVSAQEDFNR